MKRIIELCSKESTQDRDYPNKAAKTKPNLVAGDQVEQVKLRLRGKGSGFKEGPN